MDGHVVERRPSRDASGAWQYTAAWSVPPRLEPVDLLARLGAGGRRGHELGERGKPVVVARPGVGAGDVEHHVVGEEGAAAARSPRRPS